MLVLYGDETPDLKMISAKKPQVTAIKVQMSSPFGTHHTYVINYMYEVILQKSSPQKDDVSKLQRRFNACHRFNGQLSGGRLAQSYPRSVDESKVSTTWPAR